MSASVFRRKTCRLCGEHDLELVLKLAPTPVADAYVPAESLGKAQESYPLDLFLCSGCSDLQLLDVVDPGILYGDYLYVTSSSPGLDKHFESYADEVMDRVNPAKESLVIDVGSNDGTLLKFFKRQGMRVLGIDPAGDIAQKATESGIETLSAFFVPDVARKIKNERGRATIITANNVIANIDDLGQLAEAIQELLAPDGVFIFETGYLADLIQGAVFDNIYHEHLCYHSVKPLELFFRRHGMELIHTSRVPTKGGSLRGTVQLAGGPRSVSPSVAELIALEVNLGLDCAETFKAFAGKLDNVKTALLDFLREVKAQGRTIAGYGASHSVTTVIYHFGLGDILSFIVDDNPRKQNLFSPGHHIPVLSPQALYERKPDYVLTLAWRFSEQVMKKHQAYLDQGGHFIVPLPEIRVI